MEVLIYSSIQEISPQDWNSLRAGEFPFESWEHFAALEDSGCVGEEAGWIPLYLLVREQTSVLAGTYLYLKNHSYGEYIFDWQWANLAERLGVAYYPKLTAAVPFTPATGAKLMWNRSLGRSEKVEQAFSEILKTSENLAQSNSLSSAHFLFLEKSELSYFRQQGWLIRETFQFHWKNDGYQCFEDFLQCLKTRKAKEIRRERKKVSESGLEISLLTTDQLTDRIVETVYDLYLRTIDKKQSYPYLNIEYFRQVFRTMGDQVRLFVARTDGMSEICAMSLCYQEGEKIFGRYWGARREYENLHFELCYYQPIEWAIQQKLELFEAGAQGPHKIQRGFLPEITYSAHKIYTQPLDEYIERIIRYENHGLQHGLEEFSASSPYK